MQLVLLRLEEGAEPADLLEPQHQDQQATQQQRDALYQVGPHHRFKTAVESCTRRRGGR